MAEVEVEFMHKDVKDLSKPNRGVEMSQQKRREFLLEWQKSRRDEIVEKLRKLEDAGATESEGEEVDFLEEMLSTSKRMSESRIKDVNGDSLQKSFSSTNERQKSCAGAGRGKLASVFSHLDNSDVRHGSERGRGQQFCKNSANDNNWRSPEKDNKEPMEQTDIGIQPMSSRGGAPRRHKRAAPYGIMLSEWLTEVPEEFEDNWLGVLCPVGRRCIVVACRGKTKVYTRRNDYLGQFASCLPGGSRSLHYSGNRRRGLTILDCLWSDKTQMFYVLDLICWNSHSVNNCPTDLRHYMCLSKFQETPELSESTHNNAVPFLPLPFFPVENLADIMTTTFPVFSDEIDGILFYHKNVFYLPEVTPLVLWLHLSDMDTVLSVTVNPDLLAREKTRGPRTKYYLDKPTYQKKGFPILPQSLTVVREAAHHNGENEDDILQHCDSDEVPLG